MDNVKKKTSLHYKDQMNGVLEEIEKINTDESLSEDAREKQLGDLWNNFNILESQFETQKKLEQKTASDLDSAAKLAMVNGGAAGPISKPEIEAAKRYDLAKAWDESFTDAKKQLSGLELELNQEAISEQRLAGCPDYNGQGINIPSKFVNRTDSALKKVTELKRNGHNIDKLKYDVTGSGGDVVQTTITGWIPILNIIPRVTEAGATQFRNLTGNLQFPRHLTGAKGNVQNATETAATTVGTNTTDNIQLIARRQTRAHEISTQMLMQSTPDVAAFFAREVEEALASNIDKNAISGTVTSGSLFNVAGTNPVTTGGTLSHDLTVDFYTKVRQNEVRFDNTVGYLLPPSVQGILAKLRVDAGSGIMVLQQVPMSMPYDGSVLNFPVWTDSNVPENLGTGNDKKGMIFGKFRDLYLGFWGGVQILPDPYTKAANAIQTYWFNQWYDSNIARPGSFSKAEDIT